MKDGSTATDTHQSQREARRDTFNYTRTGLGVRAYVLDTGVRRTHAEFGGRVTAGKNLIPSETINNCNGHGTHVAGLLGGRSRTASPRPSRSIPVKVLTCAGSGTFANIIFGIQWAAKDRGASGLPGVASMSLGGPRSQAVDDAVESAIKSGPAPNAITVVPTTETSASCWTPASAWTSTPPA